MQRMRDRAAARALRQACKPSAPGGPARHQVRALQAAVLPRVHPLRCPFGGQGKFSIAPASV